MSLYEQNQMTAEDRNKWLKLIKEDNEREQQEYDKLKKK